MAFLIDSDWTIDFLNHVPAAVDLSDSLGPAGTFVSILTYIEVYQGVLRDPEPSVAEAALRSFLTSSPVVKFSDRRALRTAATALSR